MPDLRVCGGAGEEVTMVKVTVYVCKQDGERLAATISKAKESGANVCELLPAVCLSPLRGCGLGPCRLLTIEIDEKEG